MLEAFVRQGGYVIADVRPGLYDGHCKPLAKGLLDDLFGIRRTGRGPARKGKAVVVAADIEVTLDGVLCDAGVELLDAQAMAWCGGVPLMIARQIGEGGTLLLNFPLTSYPRLDAADTPEAAAELFLRLAASIDVRSPLRVLTGGRRTRNLEVVRWRNGELEIAALFRHTGADEDVLVDFERRAAATLHPSALVREGLSADDILDRLLGDAPGGARHAIEPRFACHCNAERVIRAALLLGRDEIRAIVEADETLEVRCEFCAERYRIPPNELGRRSLDA